MMRIRACFVLFLILLLAPTAMAQQRPFERVRRSVGAYLGERDPLGWPFRSYCMSQSPYGFWVSGQDLFFAWCKTNAGDWLADQKAIVPCHGNASLSAVGSYAAVGAFGKLAFGVQAFDDSCEMPFQYELLQGLITLRLVAEQNRINLNERDLDALSDAFSKSYAGAVSSPRDATMYFADDPWVAKLLAADSPYVDCLDRYTSIGLFRHSITGADGKPTEVLKSAQDSVDLVAAVLSDAVTQSQALARQTRLNGRGEVRDAIRDVARRTVLLNPIAPGAKEYLVLLARPLRDVDHDVIVRLRQQIPSAAERATFVPRDPRAPAERAASSTQDMMEPAGCFSGFGRSGSDTYIVQLFDPWSATLADREIKDSESLLHLAQIWGGVSGLTHHHSGREQDIASRMTPELNATLKSRAEAFLKQLREDFPKFASDPSAHADADAAKQAIDSIDKP
jgi:uncharacterized protein (DUF2252 family)